MSIAKNERTALYRHRDCNGTLLYVGISLSVAARLAQHAGTSHWFAEVTQVDVEYFPTRTEAEAAERHAIRTEHPRCNKAHVAGRPASKRSRPEALRVPLPATPEPARVVEPEPYVSDTFESVREARLHLYRAVDDLGKLAAPRRATYDAVLARQPKDTNITELGHRFWLRLTDAEFEACRWCALADELAFLLEHCEFMNEDEDWLMAADDLWDMFLLLTFKWASRRDELEFRWPELAAA